MSQEKPPTPEPVPDFLTRKEFTDWQATLAKPDDHTPEPDETYVPTWAKQLNDKVDALGKTPPAQQPAQTPPTTQVTNVDPPPPVVEPKKDFWPKNWPKIL